MRRQLSLLAILCTLVVASSVTPVVGATTHPAMPPAPAGQTDAYPATSAASHSQASAVNTTPPSPATNTSVRYALNGTTITATVTFHPGATISDLTVYTPRHDAATVTATPGFERVAPKTYRWERSATDTPEVEIQWDATAFTTPNASVTAVIDDGYVFSPLPQLVAEWRPAGAVTATVTEPLTGDTNWRTTTTTAPAVYTSSRWVLLGDHTVHSATTSNSTYRVVVPDREQPRVDPEAALDALTTWNQHLTVNGRSGDGVTLFVVGDPSLDITGAVITGSQEGWVAPRAELASPASTWAHEYSHTRQNFTTNTEMEWLYEGTAAYYAGRLPEQSGTIAEYDIQQRFTYGNYSSAVLTNRTTWSSNAVAYQKGGRIIYTLDVLLRATSNGTHSFQDVWRRLNTHDGVITYSVFREAVVDVGGAQYGPWVDKHVNGSATVRASVENHTVGLRAASQNQAELYAAVNYSTYPQGTVEDPRQAIERETPATAQPPSTHWMMRNPLLPVIQATPLSEQDAYLAAGGVLGLLAGAFAFLMSLREPYPTA